MNLNKSLLLILFFLLSCNGGKNPHHDMESNPFQNSLKKFAKFEINSLNINKVYKVQAEINEQDNTFMTFTLPALNDNGDVYINIFIQQLPGRLQIEAFKMSSWDLLPLNLQQLGLKCADGLIQQDQKIYATDKNGFNLFGEIECRYPSSEDEPISNIFYANPNQIKVFSDEEIFLFAGLSQNGMVAGVDDKSFYKVNDQKFILLYNEDRSKFIPGGTGNQIIKVTDSYILATDMRKDKNLMPNNAILLCDLTGTCHNIFKTKIPIKDGTVAMSDNGEYIYLVSDEGQGKVLMLINKSGKIISDNIKIQDLDLDKVNIYSMQVTNTGVLLLQVRDENRQRPIYVYSYKDNKSITAPALIQYFDLSKYLINSVFHGFIEFSPQGNQVLINFAKEINDDNFSELDIGNVAIDRISLIKDNLDDVIIKIK